MPDTIPVGKYYNFDNKNVDVVYNPAKDENKGGGVFIVNATPVNEGTFTPDKTFGETLEAFNAGKQVIVKIRITGGGEEAKVDCYMTVYNKTTQAEVLIGIVGSRSQINFYASGIIEIS